MTPRVDDPLSTLSSPRTVDYHSQADQSVNSFSNEHMYYIPSVPTRATMRPTVSIIWMGIQHTSLSGYHDVPLE